MGHHPFSLSQADKSSIPLDSNQACLKSYFSTARRGLVHLPNYHNSPLRISYTDLEIRYSAIDALGNFYKSCSVTAIEVAALEGNANATEELTPKQEPEPRALLEESHLSSAAENEIEFLKTHLQKSLALLVNNLRFCVQFISNTANFLEGEWFPSISLELSLGSGNSPLVQKLLVSVLRAVVFVYSSPFACFQGISTAVGKPAGQLPSPSDSLLSPCSAQRIQVET